MAQGLSYKSAAASLFYTNDKYVDHYFVLAFVNWSKMAVILSMCKTKAEAQEQIKLLTIELNNK